MPRSRQSRPRDARLRSNLRSFAAVKRRRAFERNVHRQASRGAPLARSKRRLRTSAAKMSVASPAWPEMIRQLELEGLAAGIYAESPKGGFGADNHRLGEREKVVSRREVPDNDLGALALRREAEMASEDTNPVWPYRLSPDVRDGIARSCPPEHAEIGPPPIRSRTNRKPDADQLGEGGRGEGLTGDSRFVDGHPVG